MPFTYKQHEDDDQPFNEDFCAAVVSAKGDWMNRQCKRKPTVDKDGYKWCKHHAPNNLKVF